MNEFNVCGVLVMTRPENIQSVSNELNKTGGVEVHASNSTGKLVVTVEDCDDALCIDTVSNLINFSGVISTAIIYQQSDQLEAQQELAS